MKATLSHDIKFEAFEQSLTFRNAVVDHNDGCATCQSCSVCTVADPSEVGETAALCKLIGDLQDALAQATRVMAAMANGLQSGHTAPLETASSVDSVPIAVLTPPVAAPGQMASGQPGHEGGCGHADCQCARGRICATSVVRSAID